MFYKTQENDMRKVLIEKMVQSLHFDRKIKKNQLAMELFYKQCFVFWLRFTSNTLSAEQVVE